MSLSYSVNRQMDRRTDVHIDRQADDVPTNRQVYPNLIIMICLIREDNIPQLQDVSKFLTGV